MDATYVISTWFQLRLNTTITSYGANFYFIVVMLTSYSYLKLIVILEKGTDIIISGRWPMCISLMTHSA